MTLTRTVLLIFLGCWLVACRKTEAEKRLVKGGALDRVVDSLIISGEPAGGKSLPTLDTALYSKLLLYLVHERPTAKWPAKAPYPLPGAVLPFSRIIAYYGNFYSKGMGVLGELPPVEMLDKLQAEVARWQAADPRIPVVPALHYIAVTAQRSPGKGAKYRLRMPATEIEKLIRLANSINALVFLDVQVGHSTLQEELPALAPYLSLRHVHLGIDPEYSMKGGQVPCATIGTFDAADINYASQFLASIVKQYNLPPKVLVVHRFTKDMVTNYRAIQTRPEVQIVMNMDGFGGSAKKKDSYQGAIVNEPVQFTGFKLFYRNDVVASSSSRLMSPIEVLALYPSPIYIQYQ
jgi:hypothetical protein